MTAPSHADQVAFEAATNRRYMKRLRERRFTPSVSRSRNTAWTGDVPLATAGPIVQPLVGRVCRTPSDEYPETDFYIGSWYSAGDPLVFSWAAPAAAGFFGAGADGDSLARGVVARRTLISRRDEIVDVADELSAQADTVVQPFASASPLSIPAVPNVPPVTQPPAPVPAVDRGGAGGSPAQGRPSATSEPSPAHGSRPPQSDRTPLHSVRSRAAVVRELERPREAQLTSVLATLQPDQYRLVTRDPAKPLVVQGHPGTGKTIIATHRAAYLAHPAQENRRSRVLLLGPTAEYEHHVQKLVAGLGAGSSVVVRGLVPWLQELAGVQGSLEGPTDGERADVDFDAGYVALDAVRRNSLGILRGTRVTDRQAERAYSALRRNRQPDGLLRNGPPELLAWMGSLPQWSQAKGMRRYLPLLASIGVALRPPRRQEKFDHIVVDEAQDMRPLEWLVLSAFNAGRKWTLVGDVNQRRSDWSYSDWRTLAYDLPLIGEDETLNLEVLGVGYRSTGPIMAFASKLLPPSQRGLESLQPDGPAPTVLRVPADGLAAQAVAAARGLQATYTGGTVAIITTRPRLVLPLLQRRNTGTRAYGRSGAADQQSPTVLTPDLARGLEFDAIVVVEPAAFPVNLGRHGALYTSLTRANRELVVVHSDPLPDPLRSYSRRQLRDSHRTSTPINRQRRASA